jgi:hypothetical protein
MAVTPTGLLCPFKSPATEKAATEISDNLSMYTVSPQFASELESVEQDLEDGIMPDKDKLLRVSREMAQAANHWEKLMDGFQKSPDFQTREFNKLTQEQSGQSFGNSASIMRWKSEQFKALALDEPLPEPPSHIDFEALNMQESLPDESPFPTAATIAEAMNCNPFAGSEAAFETPIVKEEYNRLCRDHANLIEFGATYGSFDRIGKLLYLDEIDKIQERWDVFLTRFSLMGALGKDYIEQCDFIFTSIGMKEAEYRQHLKDCHDLMRKEAELEN